MPRVSYIDWAPRTDADAQLIADVNRICRDFERRGYTATLRTVYYQLVAHDLFPLSRRYRREGGRWVKDEAGTANAEPNYDNLGALVTKARRAGLIDWRHLEDRTRNLRGLTHWEDPAEIIRASAHGFRLAHWDGQPTHVEVWVEKDALLSVVERAANRWDVDYFSCRGYTSDSEMWSAGQRLKHHAEYERQDVVVLHLGDHDPSGLDMTRDIRERLEMFMDGYGDRLEVRRVALNMNQIEQYDPPPNPAKTTDARFNGYRAEYGDDSWELDALDPDVIVALIEDEVASIVDMGLLEERRLEESRQREVLTLCHDRWADVSAFLLDGAS